MGRPGDNRLPQLAAEIRKAHADVHGAAKTAAQRAIDAGHALIEAKALVKHGEWLPWLREHCALAERTAQLYMKIARSGNSPELIASLGLQAAATEILQIIDHNYNPFHHCTEQGKVEWHLFVLFLSQEHNWHPAGAWAHCEWVLQKQFTTPCDWLTGEGPKCRKPWGMSEPSACFVDAWRSFHDRHRQLTVDEINQELVEIDNRIGPMSLPPPGKRRKRRIAATVRKTESATHAEMRRRA